MNSNLQNTDVKMKSSVLEPCENPTFNFPPLPRRPLRSQTYGTFLQIMSHCAVLRSPHLPPKQGNISAGETSVQNASGGRHLVPCDSVGLHEPSSGCLNGDIHKMPSEVSCLDPMDAEVEGNGKERDVNGVSSVDPGEENNAHIMIVCHIVDEMKSSCTAVGHEGIIEQKLDTLPILHDYEVPDDVSAPPKQTDDTSLKAERDLSMELRMKEKEFEELVCSPAAGDSSDCLASAVDMSVCLATADDIEEGEVSCDDAPYETMDFLFDSAEAQEGLGSENQSGAIGLSEIDMTGFFSIEEVHDSNDLLKTQSTITHLDADKVPYACEEGRVQINEAHKSDSAIEIGQILEKVVEVKSNLTAVAEDLAPHRIIITKNTTEDRDVLTDEKDVCVAKNEKRKKRGPISKETKAKKKQKERIKRAEKNRKLGVKRLKLQPVVKPIKVTYCRHYIKGRCEEGEKCKFSHDTTPLTKSTPCCHFVRGSCMKGDECPYDHQVSKYPCKKYVNNKGFCSRGADCMFSHDEISSVTTTSGSLTSCSNIICFKADLKSSPVQNSDFKQMDLLHVRAHEQFDSNSRSLEKCTSRRSCSEKKIVVQDPQKAGAVVPKGISMISFGGSSSTSSNGKHDKSSPIMPPVEENVVNLDQQAANEVKKANKMMPRRPNKGINFLSFGKTPLNASSQFDDSNNQSYSLNVVSSSSSSKKKGSENMMISDSYRMQQGLKYNISAAVSVGVEQSGLCTQGGSSCSSNPFSVCMDNYSARTSKEESLNSTLAFAAKFDSKIKLALR